MIRNWKCSRALCEWIGQSETLTRSGPCPECGATEICCTDPILNDGAFENPFSNELLAEAQQAADKAVRYLAWVRKQCGLNNRAAISTNDLPVVAMCNQCNGSAHLCELPDSTCRLKNLARDWLDDGHMGAYLGDLDGKRLDADARKLAPLLRQIEDGAWERLSIARTKAIAQLEARVTELETTIDADVSEKETKEQKCGACGKMFSDDCNFCAGRESHRPSQLSATNHTKKEHTP